MIILKCKVFKTPQDVAIFVIKNSIKREDILIITALARAISIESHIIYYYGDSALEEIL